MLQPMYPISKQNQDQRYSNSKLADLNIHSEQKWKTRSGNCLSLNTDPTCDF